MPVQRRGLIVFLQVEVQPRDQDVHVHSDRSDLLPWGVTVGTAQQEGQPPLMVGRRREHHGGTEQTIQTAVARRQLREDPDRLRSSRYRTGGQARCERCDRARSHAAEKVSSSHQLIPEVGDIIHSMSRQTDPIRGLRSFQRQ